MKLTTRLGGRSRQNMIDVEIKKFNGGVNRLLEEASIGLNEAKEATNLMQVQAGLWKPRWGTDYYGALHGASIDGASEFLKSDGTTELITIAGGTAYKSTDGGSLTALTGATFTAGTQCYFIQIAGYLYIANGTDTLARYDGTNLITYGAINAPTGLAGTASASVASGVYNMYAEVTALNSVGETTGSTEASLAGGLARPRDQWTASDNVTWTWNTVASATSYQLYISDTSGYENLLTGITASSYKDDGSVAINPYVEPPLSNTTGAPKFKSMEISGNRIWATNDPNNPYTVYFSGTGQFIGTFSDFYGGGWINLEKGGRERPKAVKHYQSGTGEGRATVLCSTPEGRGAVWQITIGTATVGDSTFAVPTAVKVVGSSGTDSQLSVVADQNNIWFFNRRGIFTLGPEKNYYGILRTNELSSRIRPYIRDLIGSAIGGVCAYYYDAKVFFSVPTTSSGNNRIIYYDTERLNWSVDWSIGAKQFLEYTDTGGTTHFLYVPLSGTKIIELSPNIQGDLGSAFSTSYVSGRWALRKLWKDFLKLKKVFIKLGNPRGDISLQVLGSTKTSGFANAGTATITSLFSLTGMGWDLMGNVKMGDTLGEPTTFSDSSDPRYIKINKKLRDIQIRLTTTSIDSDYTLQSFIFEGSEIQTRPPSGWKISNE